VDAAADEADGANAYSAGVTIAEPVKR